MRNTTHLLPLILLLLLTPKPELCGQNVSVGRKIENDSLVVYMTNSSYLPVYIQVEANENIPADSRILSDFVLPAQGGTTEIMIIPVVNPSDTTQLLQENFGKIHLKHGDPFNVEPALDFPYGLPFQRGKSYKLIQGFGGAFSHQSAASWYALDFAMAIGEKVCAARAGVVVLVKEDSREGGPSRKYKGKDNHLVILHKDGTLAYYVHLRHQGVLVEEGQSVERGQLLGLSGNTGYSTRPHLHFVIRKPTQNGPIAIPFRFDQVKPSKLRVGRKIRRKR